MAHLTITKDETGSPATFPTPHGTISAVVEGDVLNIYAKPDVHPADWDVACSLMKRIMDPAHWFTPSALSAVDYWSVSVA